MDVLSDQFLVGYIRIQDCFISGQVISDFCSIPDRYFRVKTDSVSCITGRVSGCESILPAIFKGLQSNNINYMAHNKRRTRVDMVHVDCETPTKLINKLQILLYNLN